jgi:hypothetical protein
VRWGRGHVRELWRTHGLIGGAAACSRAAHGDMPILGCGLPLRHDECDPVPTPTMADEYAALLVDTLINQDPSRKCH